MSDIPLLPLQRFTACGDSMLPILTSGDSVIIFKFLKGTSGDIVVANVENKLLIKRIKSIENGQYYLIGDNPHKSTDSRHFGPVNKSNILGKVIFVSRS